MPLPAIARLFLRDHSTVMSSVKKIKTTENSIVNSILIEAKRELHLE
jgi:chromosomal replication initiation ATPase DnaA